MQARVFVWLAAPVLLVAGAAGFWVTRSHRVQPGFVHPSGLPASAPPDAAGIDEDDHAYSFRVPSGEPSSLTCEAARSIVAQVRGNLAYDPDPVAPHALAASTADWLDPHGLWSAAPDSPLEGVIEQHGAGLVRDLESEMGIQCQASREIGRALVPWTAELAARFDKERQAALHDTKSDKPATLTLAEQDSPFEDDTQTRSARDLASLLGFRVGVVERAMGAPLAPFVEAARARFFPALDEEGWQKVVLAAAVRAYVQLVDPHGAWAPLDEEASVYEIDLESPPPSRLWERASRTAIGVSLETDPASPLQVNDVVLSIAGVATAGLPLEQVEQLGFAAAEVDGPVSAIVLRPGEHELRTLRIGSDPEDAREPAATHGELPSERIPYGPGDALVVTIHDVRDDLGDELAHVLAYEKEHDTRPLEGLVIDLRGNGGGSTEGAIAALGLFVPGAPLFPMKRRDGSIEVDRAPEPPNLDRWTGAVATLVDADTASAAEMISGALAVYHRAVSVGSQTYGKGCAQEYLDDDAHSGVLRLTTLLYALPDGAPVQRVGLAPSLLLGWGNGSPAASPMRGSRPASMPSAPPERGQQGSDADREATLPHAPPTWRGPDVRDRAMIADGDGVSWPAHGGAVGPCKDAEVCRALRAIGATGRRTPTAKGHASDRGDSK
jgi:carboxyl-terminal processing protease